MLYFLSTFIAEFLTGNTPPGLVLTPVIVPLSLLYGLGANLVRSAAAHWKKDFACVLLLGAVFAIINEAIISHGFFDPQFYAVKQMGLEGFGKAGGINIFWALGISVFHTAFSIAIPILITEALFGKDRGLPGTTSSLLCLMLFIADILFFCHVLKAYPPEPGAWACVLALMCALLLLARVVPRSVAPPAPVSRRNPLLFICGAACSLAYFFVYIRFHDFIPSAVLNMVALVSLVIVLLLLLRRFARALPEPQKIVLIGGIMAVPIVSAILHGNAIMAAVAAAVIIRAWDRSRARLRCRA